MASVVAPNERSAAGGITNVMRSLGLAAAPIPLAYLTSGDTSGTSFSAPFFIAGGLKCVYDLALYAAFQWGAAAAAAAAAVATVATAAAAGSGGGGLAAKGDATAFAIGGGSSSRSAASAALAGDSVYLSAMPRSGGRGIMPDGDGVGDDVVVSFRERVRVGVEEAGEGESMQLLATDNNGSRGGQGGTAAPL